MKAKWFRSERSNDLYLCHVHADGGPDDTLHGITIPVAKGETKEAHTDRVENIRQLLNASYE